MLDRKTARKLGVEGVLLAVQPVAGAKGKVDVEVDYSGFRHAYGGDWASRLVLRPLPSCALTIPEAKNCGLGKALATANDTKDGTLTASVALPAAAPVGDEASADDETSMPVSKALSGERSVTGLSAGAGTVLLAATAAASGSAGDFKATSLAPSASWSAGGSNGGFSWTYDIDTPEVPGGAEPDLSLSYSSQAVDGRTAATNNQSNWIGDGWSMEPGYIERQYVSCTDDTTDSNTTAKVGDLCWKKDNAVLNLGGQTNTLVKDDTTGEWHLESDDGTKAEKLTNTALANGDDNGEYWRITTPDGTRYYFGYNRPSGWATGKDDTNSAWTVPVYGNQTGEPCHATEFKDSWCQQAWRWNLDAVIDPHGDAMTYYWDKESNYYGRNVNDTTGASTATVYDRGGYLKRIEYGLRSSNFYGQAAAKVDFTVSERCLTTCTTFDSANAANWPDVPFDQYCKSGDECKDRYSPSFWTRKRLTKIDTSVYTGGAFKPVDTWALTQQFPSTGDGTSPALWLAAITRTGHTGAGDITLPSVATYGVKLANRVEGATTGGDPDPVPPLIRYRIYAIKTETGGTLGVTYSPADCKAGDMPSPATNTRRCYPVIWSPPDAPAENYEPYLDWFHTYVVTQVLESDNTAGAPVKETDYNYLDGLGWAKAEDEFTKSKYLTYGDRKGYGRVQVRTGAPAEGKQTLKEYRYFRGIDGAEVADHEGIKVTDHPAFAGMTREEATFDGDGGTLQTTTAYQPWHSAATATQARTGLSTLHAYATGSTSQKTRTAVGSGWRSTQVDREFDGYGQITSESQLGDTAKSGDEQCTTTSYARNTTANILTLIKENRTVAKACGTTPSLPADLVSVERHYYDNATSLDTAPTKGDVTKLEEQDEAGTGYLTTSTDTYDIHGRELTTADALGNTTTTAYTPTTGEAPTKKTETNALGHITTTEYDPVRGVATANIDANGKRTDAVHDGLGRVLKVWTPGWAKADHSDQPSQEYSYKISKTEPNVVTTKSLKRDGSYATAYTLYDGLMRERETQAPAIGTSNRIITEKKYDTRGSVWKTYGAYYADGAPSTTLVTGADNQVPTAAENVYDGLGRVTAAISRKFGDEKWRTTTTYDGDRTTVIPPSGGTATTTIVDALGRTTDLLEYTNADRTASQKTTYAYGKYDEPTKVTDPSGNEWVYTFDGRGQQTKADDPDKGVVTTAYDKVGRETSSTDERGTTLTTAYDKLGRQTQLKQGSTVLSEWTYDTVAKGQLTSSTRYADGSAYTTATGGFTDRYQPTSTTVTIPAGAGSLAGSYGWTYGYDAATGLLDWTMNPAIGDVTSERVTVNYNSDDLPIRTSRAGAALVSNTLYDVFSRPTRTEFGALGKQVYQSQVYDEFTGLMTRQTTDRDLAPQRIDDSTYAYDPAGNVTGITTASGQDAAQSVDTQCFTDDKLGRLTEAWTAKTDCSTAPSATTAGGPDAYWQTYSYDALGNRTKLVEHGTGTQAGTDATTTYTHPAPKTDLPHAVQEATISGGPNNGQKSTFGYDKAGNTTKRVIGTRSQDLTWDAEGHLATLTESGKTTSYLYDADGNRLLAKNGDGTSTLTLPNGNEITLTTTGTKAGTRYYNHNGDTVAVRTSKGISYLFTDHQGTSMAAVASATLDITRRKQDPFGEIRSAGSSAFPGTQGFVGGTTDPTGLTHLGAREYDPNLGRFLSVDPVIDHDDPAQMNAYSYAHNNPVTKSDPDGLRPLGPTDGGQAADDRWAADRGMSAGYTYKNGKWVWKQTPKKDKSSRQKYAAYQANPAHYMIDDGHAQARAKQQAAARAQAIKAAKAKADAERRKKDGIWGSIKKGNFGAAWDNAKQSAPAQWIVEHRADIATWAGYASIGVCLFTAGVGCAVVGGIALGASVFKSAYDNGIIGSRRRKVGAFVTDLAKDYAFGKVAVGIPMAQAARHMRVGDRIFEQGNTEKWIMRGFEASVGSAWQFAGDQ
ncbi:RHS repeat domain-containing protein [Streptomyces sp. NPDC005262]|uniref:RHS repeat domain-containing protein n=1 Tax=Streptomyces sp. NPDC005262 TaxID=3364710 RepID=UPI003675DC71